MKKRKPNNMRTRMERANRALLNANHVAVVHIDPSGRQGMINRKSCKSIPPGQRMAEAVCDFAHRWTIYVSVQCRDQRGHRYTKSVEPFQREDRYIVIKRSDMEKLPIDQRRNFAGRCRALHEQMFIAGAHARSFLVIESDWPEYEPVWQMIERRMAGQPPVTAAEELDAVLHWRGKHTQAIRECDALQLRLNAAD